MQKTTLTKQENAFLNLLIQRPGVIVTHDQVIDHVWNGNGANEHSVRALACRLRKKLESDIIKSASGRGYYLNKWNKPEHIIY